MNKIKKKTYIYIYILYLYIYIIFHLQKAAAAVAVAGDEKNTERITKCHHVYVIHRPGVLCLCKQ